MKTRRMYALRCYRRDQRKRDDSDGMIHRPISTDDEDDPVAPVEFVEFPVPDFGGQDPRIHHHLLVGGERRVGGESSPTTVREFNSTLTSWEQFHEVFGPPFSKQAPEEILPKSEEPHMPTASSSPTTIIHVIPNPEDVDKDGSVQSATRHPRPETLLCGTPESAVRGGGSRNNHVREDSTKDVVHIPPAAPQKGERPGKEKSVPTVEDDWDLADYLAMKDPCPSPERPVLKTPLLPKSFVDMKVDMEDTVSSWTKLFNNVAGDMVLCTNHMTSDCHLVPDLKEPTTDVDNDDERRNSMRGGESLLSPHTSIPAEKKPRLGKTPTPSSSHPGLTRVDSTSSLEENGLNFGVLLRLYSKHTKTDHPSLIYPDCDELDEIQLDDEEDDVDDVDLNGQDIHDQSEVVAVEVLGETMMNRRSLSLVSPFTKPILKLPKSNRVRLSLKIDEYDIRKYNQILKELNGNQQIYELDIRRARSIIMRHRSIHDLLQLFSVLETMPCIVRLYLQDFTSNELELIPFEELLESNTHLSSLEIWTNEEPEVDSFLLRRGYVI